MTPYYADDAVTIYHGRCEDILPISAACVVTSPPYNVGIDYSAYDDARAWADYWRDVEAWATAIADSLQPTGRSWVNIAPVVQEEPGGSGRNGHHSGRSLKVRQSLMCGWSSALERAGLQPADTIAWTSQRGSGTAWGSYELPSAPNLRGDWEAIHVHYKHTWPRIAPPGFDGWRDTQGRWPELVTNVWNIRPEQRNGHPAPFPIEIPARAIRLSTWPGETVLDPFAGSGATLRAAKDLGRKAIGVERDERYCELAALKLGQEVLAL